jgi:hypothetical protein
MNIAYCVFYSDRGQLPRRHHFLEADDVGVLENVQNVDLPERRNGETEL